MSMTLLIAATGTAAVSYVAVRGHRAAIAARRGLLDQCVEALDCSALSHHEDGIPKLSGSHGGRGVLVDLILDTLTMRRLPQLWLSTTFIDQNPQLPRLGVLVRHCGTEFYSLSSHFEHRFETPAGFPSEVVVRGDADAGGLLAVLAPALSEILQDARVKEVAVTERGFRIVRQASEGKRGDHLLLRQPVFENAQVPRADFVTVLDQLDGLRDLATAHVRKYAA